MIKPLNDSCYVRPQDNPRVIQDMDAAKRNALEKANARH